MKPLLLCFVILTFLISTACNADNQQEAASIEQQPEIFASENTSESSVQQETDYQALTKDEYEDYNYMIEQSTPNDGYQYTGETNITIEDRSLILEDTPESKQEETVILDFRYTITAEFDKKYEILADIAPHSISIENEKKRLEDGVYIESYVIHKITSLTEGQYSQENLANGEVNPLHYRGWEKCIDDYNLIEYEIINVDFTITYSPKMNERGPQYSEGTHNRSYIVGKTSSDDSYKIYAFGFM